MLLLRRLHMAVAPRDAAAAAAFARLGVNSTSLGALADQRIVSPTPIQTLAIPVLLGGRSALLSAETGSGKTLAFALPLAERLVSHEAKLGCRASPGSPRALVLLPTRELASQVGAEFKKLSHHFRFAARVLAGGNGRKAIKQALASPVDVLVSCPHMLRDLAARNDVRLRAVQALVVDEADTMLNSHSGFADDVTAVARQCPAAAQIVLAGATVKGRGYCRDWLRQLRGEGAFDVVETEGAGRLPVQIKLVVETVDEYDKHPALLDTVRAAVARNARLIVFCNSVPSCRSTAHVLEAFASQAGIANVCSLHGDMLPMQRAEAWRRFTSTPAPAIAVCTDVAARGLDVADVDHVVLFDVPRGEEDFVHRAGRTGRGGKGGRVTVIAGRGEKDWAQALLQRAR